MMMKRLRKVVLAAFVLLLLLAVGGSILWRSEWLATKIRERAIAEIYNATGAVASFGNFEWDYSSGIVRIHDVTIRGTETANDPPFVHVKTAEITLKILSFINPNVDVRAVRAYEPRVYVITYPDGTTNVPHRQRGRRPDEVLAGFIKLGINRLDAEHGIFSWDHQEIPFDFHGEELQVAMTLDKDRYRGAVQGERMALTVLDLRELRFSLASSVTLENNSVQFENLHALSSGMRLEASGQLKDWLKPVLTAKVKASGPVHELVSQFRVPLLNQGEAEAAGEVIYQDGWKFNGSVAGKNLGYQDARINLRGVNASGEANYSFTKTAGHQLELTKLRADAPQGSFRGAASATSTTYKIRGTVGNLHLDDAQHFIDPALPSWGALVNGPVLIEGTQAAAKVTARLTLTPTDSDRPLSGNVNLVYDSGRQNVQVTATHLQSNATKMDVAGDLVQGLDVDLTTSNLAELPFLSRLPVRIESGGAIEFRGLLTGGLSAPLARGQLNLRSITVEGEPIDRARMRIDAASNLLKVDQMEVYRGAQTLTGAVQVGLFNWEARDASPVQGQISANGIEVSPYLADARGRVKGTAQVSGTMQDPKLEGDVEWTDAAYQTQTLGNVTGRVTYGATQVEIRNGRVTLDRQPVDFAGTYSHAPKDFRNGSFQASAKGSGMTLERLAQFRERFPLWSGRVDVDGRARGRIANGVPDFSLIDGRAVIQQAAYNGRALGALTIHARTEGATLRLTANGVLRGASVTANSQWQLAGLMPGKGDVQISGAKIDDFQDLVLTDASPLDVRMEASGAVRGNLRQPEALEGNVRISQLAVTPRQAMSDVARRDFTLRNDGPIEIAYDAKGFEIKQARLVAKDTTLTASGLLSTAGAATANLHVVGEANLAVLSALKSDLIASGGSTLDLTVRGTMSQPLMAGRMTLRDASFFLRDVPNGLERVNGVVFFDRSRARLENLTAQSGGGNIRLSGFIGFSGELIYQLQAQADNVRVRYPEGVSTAVNSSLTLAGSASRSLLSGSVTLLRAGLNPRTDLGAMIAESSKSTTAPLRIENEFLKNMQFDVRIDTALNAQLTTSLTQNVEAEVNLRLRGTPARPLLLGRTSFTQGEINFFGTKYTIDRGELNFYNQTKIEPVINLDLQTRVRGVVVTINFSGPASKLNLSYRSDPPLQSSEILALLTVGRAPSGSVASGASVQSPTFLQGASSALLGQAVASPITGRMQRFFGVSRVRIDPQLVGLENAAQARLTIEQQVSRDITVTYIANLNRTQQQLVSVEWDFSREFSALAVRDENGVFGLDFFYRKRFK